jgi:C-terminal processing protease CtpA/Prc
MSLTNEATSGAGEALAAALRFVKSGLIIGGTTAGTAVLYEEFSLSNGQVIRIASESVQLGDGTILPRTGITPDIKVAVTPDDNRRYIADPYWNPNPGAESQASRRRITEADLVRQRREGIPLQEIIASSEEPPATAPNRIIDPVLNRALDMLKALSVVQTWNRPE